MYSSVSEPGGGVDVVVVVVERALLRTALFLPPFRGGVFGSARFGFAGQEAQPSLESGA